MKIKQLIVLFGLFAVALAGCQESKPNDEINLSVEAFAKEINNEKAYLLDVRTPGEVAEGVIEGAEVLDFMSKAFQQNYTQIPKDKSVYLYCRPGNRSGKALAFLKEKGYTSVYHLKGGTSAWLQAGQQLKREE